MTCEHEAATQAWFDGELDAAQAEQVDRHVRACHECSASLAAMHVMRNELRATLGVLRAPAAARSRVLASIRELNTNMKTHRSHWRLPVFWWGTATGAMASMLLVGTFWLAQIWATNASLLATLVNEHSASLLSGKLVSVESSAHHTVKPWLATHADVSPVVENFAAQGFELIGGRIEPVQHQRAAVVVYRYGPHLINVFSWAKQSHSQSSEQGSRGFNVECWVLDDIQYCAVSDVSVSTLKSLKALLTNEHAKIGHAES